MTRWTWYENDPSDRTDEAIGHIEKLADYAASRNLDAADELLTEMLAAICALSVPADAIARARNRGQGMRVLHQLSDLDRPHDVDPQSLEAQSPGGRHLQRLTLRH